MKKRFFAFFVATCMVCTLLPTFALAASGSMENFRRVKAYPAGKFTDVATTSTFYENIKTGYEMGLINGTTETTYNPSGNITIGAALALACRLHSLYYTGEVSFVQGNPWYQVYEDYALEKGIIEDAFSNYSAKATRSQFAKLFYKALPVEALSPINTLYLGAIPDVKGNEDYAEAVYALYNAGIIMGSDAYGTFYPDTTITRGAVAAIVTRMADTTLRREFVLEKIPLHSEKVKSMYGKFVTYYEIDGKLYSASSGAFGWSQGYYVRSISIDGERGYYIEFNDIEKLLSWGSENYKITTSSNPYLAGSVSGKGFQHKSVDGKSVSDFGPYQYITWREFTGPSTAVSWKEWSYNGKTLTVSSDMGSNMGIAKGDRKVVYLDGVKCICTSSGLPSFEVQSVLDYFGFSYKIDYGIYRLEVDTFMYNYPVIATVKP